MITINKEFIEDLLGDLQDHATTMGGYRLFEVEFFSGLKPHGYFVPDVHFSTKSALESVREGPKSAWHCEIFVNGLCVFREFDECRDKELFQDVEVRVLKRLVRSIMRHGIFGAYEETKALKVSQGERVRDDGLDSNGES